MKLRVKPEGRENLWIPIDNENLKQFIESRNLDAIHNFRAGQIIIGADHEVDSVLEDIDRAERICIFTDEKENLGHSLALIINNRLECYNIGKITFDNIEEEK